MDKENIFPDQIFIGDTPHNNALKSDLQVNIGNLTEEFAHHAERFAWYATAYELALDHELRLKEKLKKLYAILDHEVRQQGKDANVKLTEKMVENTVITHTKYTALENQYQQAQLNTGLWKVAKESMTQRRDMLIQLGANYRAEGNVFG